VPYPVRFDADYASERSRLTVVFRLILVIPLAIAVFFYAIAATFAVIVAWFAIVITARYPAGLYEFMAGYTRFITRITGYALLLCDPYPSFSAAADRGYPVRVEFAGPLASYSRPKTFFRFILAIPIVILRYIVALLLQIGAVGAWLVIVVTGRLPWSFFDLMAQGVAYLARSDAYLFLLTETYPPFEDSRPALEAAEPSARGALTAWQDASTEAAQPSRAETQPAVGQEQAQGSLRKEEAQPAIAADAARPGADEGGAAEADEPPTA
jgi:hypothetical protein